VLWDKDEVEIVGAYRFASAKMLHESIGENALYSQSLFEYHDAFSPYFDQGLELGRSFVQPKYWGRRSLEYFWQGIGAFLIKNPQYRYLFGPVSLSDSLPVPAKEMLVFFYQHHFATKHVLATSFNSYQFTDERQHQLHQLFNGNDYADNFKILKRTLSNMGVSVPTLFKQYGELCDNNGVQFLDFGIDAEFGDCIDGVV